MGVSVRLLQRRIQDETRVARYWRLVWGAWTLVVSLAFGLVSITDLGQPISKLGPFVAGFGILYAITILLTKFKPNQDS